MKAREHRGTLTAAARAHQTAADEGIVEAGASDGKVRTGADDVRSPLELVVREEHPGAGESLERRLESITFHRPGQVAELTSRQLEHPMVGMGGVGEDGAPKRIEKARLSLFPLRTDLGHRIREPRRAQVREHRDGHARVAKDSAHHLAMIPW
jgi:hypothetical protein